MERVIHDLYGNGQPGFIEVATNLLTRADERGINEEKHRNKRDEEIKRHLEQSNQKMTQEIAQAGLGVAKKSLLWTIAQTCIALAAVAVAVLAIVATLYIAKHGALEPFDLFHRLQTDTGYTASVNPIQTADQ